MINRVRHVSEARANHQTLKRLCVVAVFTRVFFFSKYTFVIFPPTFSHRRPPPQYFPTTVDNRTH